MNRILKKLSSKSSTIKELLAFLWANKLWWMIPIVVVFLLLALLVAFASSPTVVPFIYTLF